MSAPKPTPPGPGEPGPVAPREPAPASLETEPRRLVDDDEAPSDLRAAVALLVAVRPEGYSKERARARLTALVARRLSSGGQIAAAKVASADRPGAASDERPQQPVPRPPSGRRSPRSSARLTPRKPRMRAPLPTTREDEALVASRGPLASTVRVGLGALLGAGLSLGLASAGLLPVGAPRAAAPAPMAHDEVVAYGEAKAVALTEPAEALRRVERDNLRFARGQLAEEREALAVESLWAMGRKEEAAAGAARFLREHPASALGPRLRPMAP